MSILYESLGEITFEALMGPPFPPPLTELVVRIGL